jgi:host factor-I protein
MAMHSLTELTSLQKAFFDNLVENRVFVAIYLKNGIKLKGVIKAYNTSSITLSYPGHQTIYQKAVSTIAPLLTFENFSRS